MVGNWSPFFLLLPPLFFPTTAVFLCLLYIWNVFIQFDLKTNMLYYRDLWQCTSNLCDAPVRSTGRAPCWRPALCDRRGPWGPGPQTAASSADAFSPAGGAERQCEIDREQVGTQRNKERRCPESWAVL